MKRVCFFNFPPVDDFHGFRIETFDPLPYFSRGGCWSFSEFLSGGLNGYDKRRAILAGSVGVDRLYRERDQNYMRMASDFIDRFKDFDYIIMGAYNFIHPEILVRELKKPIKILGFVDDPVSTYARGIPYVWAFDAAFFISPSYIDDLLFETAIRRWYKGPVTWWPLNPFPFERPHQVDDAFFRNRHIDVVYVGNPYASKVNRLIELKRHFGSRLRVHGRWPLKGYVGYIRALLGKPVYPHRVTSVSSEERTQLYWRSKIGLNMHFSDLPSETGNLRMYEVPAHGMLMVCDKSGGDGHATIFEPNQEAVYYDSFRQAIDLIEYYLNNDNERVRIAANGFHKYWEKYEWSKSLLSFLQWCETIKR